MMGKEIRIIKRYKNRKLYDTSTSRYLVLGDIYKMIREGLEVRIIDNSTSVDLTYTIFNHILFTRGKNIDKIPNLDDINLLTKVMRSPKGNFISYIEALEKFNDSQITPDINIDNPNYKNFEDTLPSEDQFVFQNEN